MVAATLMPFFIIMCELFNGILQPHQNMPAFWAYTMYYVTPFTYWIGGVLASVLGGVPVVCNEGELTLFESPPNITCGEYAGPWLAEHGVGYLSNPNGQGECGYCEYSYGDDVRSPSISFYLTVGALLTDMAVLIGHWSRFIQDLALLWYFRGVCDIELPHGLSSCLCSVGDEAILAAYIALTQLRLIYNH